MRNIKRFNIFFTVVFFLSGISGLIYESIWTKYLKLFLGHAAYAQALVLVVFMGGMSIGAWLIGQKAEKIKNPLRAYALVEFAIGVFALGFDRFYLAITGMMYESWLPVLNSTSAYVLTWTIAAVMILPPAILLGATFPLMSNGVTRLQPMQSGRVVASLYFVNSLGGALGVLLNSFFLVEWLGLPGSILTAGIVNILLALMVWLATSNYRAAPLHSHLSAKNEPVWSVLWIAGLTGCASFMYEIGWIRMLSMVLGSSTHSFELMLSAFITGLALGGWWVKHRIDKLQNSMRFLAVVQLLMGSAAIMTLWGYSQTFEVISWVYSTVQRNGHGYQVYTLVSHFLAFTLMVPATFCAGMTLPLITHWLIKSGYGERAVGHVYSANTVGSILGVLIAVHLVMPNLGLKWVVLIGAIIDIALGIWILWFYKGSQRAVLRVLFAIASVGLVFITVTKFELDPARMASGVFRTGVSTLSNNKMVEKIVDGKTATISVLNVDNKLKIISTNGKPDASLYLSGDKRSEDERTMALLGSIGFAHHDNPKMIAAIGMGSGMSSHFVLSSAVPARLDTIEIEPVVVDLAKQAFGKRVERTFTDPRSNIVIEDAKIYFAMGNKKYDIIISEPSNPWVSGVSTLFTREFYKHLSRHLNSEGVLVQWVQAYETDLRIVATIVKALRTEFNDYAMYYSNEGDLIIVATKEKRLKYNFENLFKSPALKMELAHLSINNVDDVRARLIGDKRTLDNYFTGFHVPINSDFFPYIDIHAARLRFGAGSATALIGIVSNDFPSLNYFHPEAAELDLGRVTQSEQVIRTLSASSDRHVVEWMLDGHYSDDVEPVRNSFLYLNSERDCSQHSQALLRHLYTVGRVGLTIKDPKQRDFYWQKIAAHHCFKDNVESQVLLELFIASANADYVAMCELSLKLLNNPKLKISSAPWLGYPVKALLIAEIKLGRTENVSKYWQKYVVEANSKIENSLDFQILFMMAKTKVPLQ